MYDVAFEPRAKKELDALPRADGDRVTLAIRRLADNPRPAGCLKVSGSSRDLYRIRIGHYRAVYEIRDEVLVVLIIRAAKRDEATYRNL